MTLKSIDMQVAFLRQSDASNLQQQMTNKPLWDQDGLAAGEIRHTDELRTKSAKLEAKEDPQINDHSRHGGGSRQESRKKNGANGKKENRSEHPYKGKHIDLSL
ncbi:MAG TPA: hypothetical protein VF260_12305 [Bacilli bacterium]